MRSTHAAAAAGCAGMASGRALNSVSDRVCVCASLVVVCVCVSGFILHPPSPHLLRLLTPVPISSGIVATLLCTRRRRCKQSTDPRQNSNRSRRLTNHPHRQQRVAPPSARRANIGLSLCPSTRLPLLPTLRRRRRNQHRRRAHPPLLPLGPGSNHACPLHLPRPCITLSQPHLFQRTSPAFASPCRRADRTQAQPRTLSLLPPRRCCRNRR